ncbi:MAG: LemA family protein [Chloroflexi bacterium]|nr:LemA family protein [Chloroflexota bacterium]
MIVVVAVVRMYNGLAVAAGAGGPAQAAAAEGILTTALRSLFAVVENYPDLKASQNVSALQAQLATTENQIAVARDAYNSAVRDYDAAIATFPAALMAGPMGFMRREFFEAGPEAGEVPNVQLG